MIVARSCPAPSSFASSTCSFPILVWKPPRQVPAMLRHARRAASTTSSGRSSYPVRATNAASSHVTPRTGAPTRRRRARCGRRSSPADPVEAGPRDGLGVRTDAGHARPVGAEDEALGEAGEIEAREVLGSFCGGRPEISIQTFGRPARTAATSYAHPRPPWARTSVRSRKSSTTSFSSPAST